MDKVYAPQNFEEDIVRLYEELWDCDSDDKESFVFVMPPPNITGKLHMGHALNNTIQDSIARYKRMHGYNVAWIPGIDHASIATELKVVQRLAEKGISKQDLGREAFVQEAYKWKEEYGNTIIAQLKRIGCSANWGRLAFSMDEQRGRATLHAFVRLYKEGLIYQGDKIVNWCISCKTAISDTEVEYQDSDSLMYHIKYPTVDGQYIVVATTRPETMLGDVAVAVHPDDLRYKHIVKKISLPLTNRQIPIIRDSYVDKDFGTGAVKITPAHDSNDYEIGQRHNLQSIVVMDDTGHITVAPYNGMERYRARKQIVSDLDKLDLLQKTVPHSNSIGKCHRCQQVVEPMLKRQWFVSMQPLAKPAIKAVETGKVAFVPKRFEKIYLHWMHNIKDWCISRQLWWGHRIPAYHCSCGNTVVSLQTQDVCDVCGDKMVQDDGVLDTWFSSALWPFSTVGYPDTVDNKLYPNSVLVTAYDIIFFWVARMIFSGLWHMGDVPFGKVLIHGIVRDEQGKKMSKSLGNGVDPLDTIQEYGTDSMRFALLSGSAMGQDISIGRQKLEKSRAFVNKVWNAARFVLYHIQQPFDMSVAPKPSTLADSWILTRASNMLNQYMRYMERYEVGRATDCLYSFVWDDFCDWYIEIAKVTIKQNREGAELTTLPQMMDKERGIVSRQLQVLQYILGIILESLHPIIPFVTEYIYRQFGSNILAQSQSVSAIRGYKADADRFERIVELIRAVRVLRKESGIPDNKRVKLYLDVDPLYDKAVSNSVDIVAKLTLTDVEWGVTGSKSIKWAGIIGSAYIEIDSDSDEALQRVCKELECAQKELLLAQSKLDNPGFVTKAPKHLIQAEIDKVDKYSKIINDLQS